MEHWSYDAAVGAVQSDKRGVHKDVDNSLLPFQSDRKTVPRNSVSSSVIAAKAESDAQLSKLIDAMLSKLESEENSVSDEETDPLETLVQICDVYNLGSFIGSSYVEMSVESASKETILRLVSSLTVGACDTFDLQDLRKKIHHFDVNKILYSISPFTSTLVLSASPAALFLGSPDSVPSQAMIDNSIRIRSRDLRAIRKSSSKWKSWIHQWTKKLHERHSSSASLSGDGREGKLLCRICERLIPSEEMPRHSEHCMQWPLIPLST